MKDQLERFIELAQKHKPGWEAKPIDIANYRQGRIYATKEEAEAAAPKIREAWGE